MLQLIQRVHLTSNDSSDLSDVINCLVVYNIVLQSFILVVTVDVGKLVYSALEQPLCDLSIKLHHNFLPKNKSVVIHPYSETIQRNLTWKSPIT